jgi:dolichol-phosphate mannosyltransferase
MYLIIKDIALQSSLKMSVCRIGIILPCFNEEENIQKLIARIEKTFSGLPYSFEILVVDDGCTDKTVQRIRELKAESYVRVVSHPKNLGLAGSIKTAFETLIYEKNPSEIWITLDADNTHDPECMPLMIQRILSGNDVVIASRFVQGGKEIGVPLKRRLLSHTAFWAFKFLFPIQNVHDYTCGYRAYRKQILEKAFSFYRETFLEARGFGVMTEILLKLRRLGIRCDEVPLVLRYDSKRGESKMRLLPTLEDYGRVLLKNLKSKVQGKKSLSVATSSHRN